MKGLFSGAVCVAFLVALNMAAFAQTTKPSPGQQPAATSAQQAAGDQQVTVTGCIQREADYRRAQSAGRGGAAGTGVGVGNEFVLANASLGAAAGGGRTGTPTGTSGAAATGTAYELTGANEGKATQFVGQRVEIAGTLKAAEVTASGAPTGGATAGKPPEGIDVASADLKLRELEVSSIKKAAGTCPAP